MSEKIETLKDALKYLGEHATQNGGISYATEADVNVPVKPGETLAIVRMLPNGTAEVLLPVQPTKTLSFGRYYVGMYLLKLHTPEVTQ